MAIRVNQDAVAKAEELIREHQYVKESTWSDAQASTDEENAFIKRNGWDAFAAWHLAYDTDESEETKARYKFPFGDFRRVNRSGVIAAKQRAGSEDYDEVQKAAAKLLDKLSANGS